MDKATKAAGREVCVMRWGLVPSFAKRAEDYDVFKGGSSTFNARMEGVQSSSLWRRLLDSKRGVVLLDGFFEWKTQGKSKVPMFIRHADNYQGHSMHVAASNGEAQLPLADEPRKDDGPPHAPLLLAALYDVWHGGKDCQEVLESVTILTMEPDGTPMSAVHDRMPVFLTPETAALWLDASASWANIAGHIVQNSQVHAQSHLVMYEVSTFVSNVKNESPDCILPKKDYDARQLSKGIGRFLQKKSDASKGEAVSAATSQLHGQMRSEKELLTGKRKCSAEPESTSKVSKVIELD
jgi:putative SOS response-associated peptidase YedK